MGTDICLRFPFIDSRNFPDLANVVDRPAAVGPVRRGPEVFVSKGAWLHTLPDAPLSDHSRDRQEIEVTDPHITRSGYHLHRDFQQQKVSLKQSN